MSNYVWSDPLRKKKLSKKLSLADFYLEETNSIDSSIVDTESMLSYLSNINDAWSNDSLDCNNYEDINPVNSNSNNKQYATNGGDEVFATNNISTTHVTSVSDGGLESRTRNVEENEVSEITKKINGEFSISLDNKNRKWQMSCTVYNSVKNNTEMARNEKNNEFKNAMNNEFENEMNNEFENEMNKKIKLFSLGTKNMSNTERKQAIKNGESLTSISSCTSQGVSLSNEQILTNTVVSTSSNDPFYVPTSQLYKVSPFDGVPGFRDCSLKSAKRRSLRQKENYSGKLTNSKNIEKHNMTASRDQWIQFEDTNKLNGMEGRDVVSNFNSEVDVQHDDWACFYSSNGHTNGGIYTELMGSEGMDGRERLLDHGENVSNISNAERLRNKANKNGDLLRSRLGREEEDSESDEKVFLFHKTKLKKDAESELSDEVISLDYESEEENKKLRDTPVKQYPDVMLFRASSANKKNNNRNVPKTPNIDIRPEHQTLDDYPGEVDRKMWPFWFRHPDRKKKVGGRKWALVNVTVEGDFIKISGETSYGCEILKEIPLQPYFVFSVPVLHSGNKDGRMRSVKLQYVKYRETRKLKSRVVLEHAPIYTPVLKIGSRDVLSLREFTDKVENVIRRLPTHRAKGLSYRHEEIFMDCDDNCQFLLSGNGDVLSYNITVILRLRVFVTGNPEFTLFLNDINCKEILSKTKEKLLRESKSIKWINPEVCEYHPCVDEQKSSTNGGVVFTPPDGCSFELLRFRVHRKGSLPLIAKSSLELLSGNSVRLQASVQINGDGKSLRHKRNDVSMYFPIPPAWSSLFVRSTTINGTKKYIKTNLNSKMKSPSVATLSRVTLQVSCGKAKYEPAVGSIVWKLNNLPVMLNGVAADVKHTFQCFLELPFPLEIRDEFQPYSYVEFNIGNQYASGTNVEEILLSDGRVPDKWVCYRTNYFYKLSMTLIENGRVRTSIHKN